MPTTSSSQVRQLGDGSSTGLAVGSKLDVNGNPFLLGFYTDQSSGSPVPVPVSQPSGPGQAAIPRGNPGGTLATIKATSLTPTTVAANTTAEYTFSAVVSTASASGWQVATGDILIANKPTALAGVGIGNVRVAGTNSIGLTFSNYTAGTLTPTAQTYGFIAIRGMSALTAVLTPAAVQPNTTVEQQFAVAGLRSGAKTLNIVTKPTAQAGIDIVGSRSVSDNVLGITFANLTAATVTPTAGETYSVLTLAGLDSMSNVIGINYLSSGAVTVASTAVVEQGWTVTNLAATDMVMGLSKPTATANLGVAGWRVSAANTLGITFVNQTTTNTPPTTDVYSIFIYRPAPVAPLVVYNTSLAPVSVAANTTAEQTFTVTGLLANTLAAVNKPTWQAGLGIVGVRVSAANTLAITYANSSAAAITPATEAYVIGNFQLPLGDAGSTWIQEVSLTAQTQSILGNSQRLALVDLNLIAGA